MTEDERVVEEDWQLFHTLTHMANHWDRPGWPQGRRAYYWYLTFEHSSELMELADKCQKVAALPHFSLVPLGELHMTIDRIGYVENVQDQDLQKILKMAEMECDSLAPFDCFVGPLSGSPGAVRLSVVPWRPIYELRDALRRATLAALPDAEPDEGRFRPHVGIGYCNSQIPAEPVIEAVAQMRNLPTATVTIESANLVMLERKERYWQWETQAQIRLGAVS